MITIILAILSVVSICYYLTCIYAARRFFSRPSVDKHIQRPPASIMIPLCGKDFEAYENYVSFCLQDYSDYQIVFGVGDEADSSIPVIRRLMTNFPRTDITLVADAGAIGENPKVNNLHNMLKSAKHELIVLVDSDIRVQSDYLATYCLRACRRARRSRHLLVSGRRGPQFCLQDRGYGDYGGICARSPGCVAC